MCQDLLHPVSISARSVKTTSISNLFSKTDLGKAKGEEHKCSHDLLHPGSMSDPCKGNENSCFHWDSSTFNGEKIEKVKVCCCSGDL